MNILDRPARRARRHRARDPGGRRRFARRCRTRAIDWLVDAKHAAIVLDLVAGVNRVVALDGRSFRERGPRAAARAPGRRLRRRARSPGPDEIGGARTRIGRTQGRRVFDLALARERRRGRSTPRPTMRDAGVHVIRKNLRLLRVLGIDTDRIEFPLVRVHSAACARVLQRRAGHPFALINPGAAWPNKRWPAARFGEVAAFLHEVRGMPVGRAVGTWRSGARARSRRGLRWRCDRGAANARPRHHRARSRGRAGRVGRYRSSAPRSGGWCTPIVALFGPTDPGRNGPWSPDDVVVEPVRSVPLSLRATVSPERLVPRHRYRRGGERGDSAAAVASACQARRHDLTSDGAWRDTACGSDSWRRRSRLWLAHPSPADAWRSAARSRSSAKRCGCGRPGISRKAARSRRRARIGSTRHPLYLGSAIIGVGFAIAPAAPSLPRSGRDATSRSRSTSAIRSEERHLTDKFGAAYPAYRDGRAPEMSTTLQPARGRWQIASIARSRGWPRRLRCSCGRFYNRISLRDGRAAQGGVRAVSSVVEHRPYTPAVTGSNPVPPIGFEPPALFSYRGRSSVG